MDNGPFAVGVDLSSFGQRESFAVVLEGTIDAARVVEMPVLQGAMMSETIGWLTWLAGRYPHCRVFVDKNPLFYDVLERHGSLRNVRQVLLTRNTKQRLQMLMQGMAQWGAIDLQGLPITHQVACALAIDALPRSKVLSSLRPHF